MLLETRQEMRNALIKAKASLTLEQEERIIPKIISSEEFMSKQATSSPMSLKYKKKYMSQEQINSLHNRSKK